MTGTNQPEVHRGLKDLCFDRSPTTFIDGRAGELRYRGYSIHELAARSSFEETAYLLLHGELPTASELTAFDAALKEARRLPAPIHDIIRAVRDAHPMDVLRTAVSALAAYDPETGDNSLEATRRKGIRLTSQVPMIVAAHYHLRQDRVPVAANADLGHAANFLHMLKGEPPSADAASLMDTDMVLHAEHGSNASSFTARVVVSTDANFARRHHRGGGRALRPRPWGGGGERDAHGEGDRGSVPGRRLRPREAQGPRADHGLRPPGSTGPRTRGRGTCAKA